jgi:RimJ/RimL family protein N-acetyltransferase
MNIRVSTLDDLQSLHDWIPDAHACKTWGGPKVRFPFTVDTVREDIQFDLYNTYSLIGEANELLGLGQVVDIDDTRFHLARVIIRPDRQNKGLGFEFCKALIEEGLSKYGKRNITLKVNLDNQRAIKLYQRMGFRPATGELSRNVSSDAMIMILEQCDLDELLNE